MSRKILIKKQFPDFSFKSNNFIYNLFLTRILKKGKIQLAKKILDKTFYFLKEKTGQTPLVLIEKALRNGSPSVQLKSKRIGGGTYQIPILLNKFQALKLAIRWLLIFSKKRNGKNFATKLALEILDASKNSGSVIKRKEEIHKMAEANKTYLQFN